MSRICASRTCSKRFIPQGNRKKYCSPECSKRENQRKYAQAHPEKVRAGMRRWEEANREKRRAYNRVKQAQWRAANQERERRRGRIAARKWRKEHHETFLATQRRRRAEKREILLEQRRAREGSIPRTQYLKRLRKPQKPGRRVGRLSQDTDARITVVADCMLRGMNVWKLAPRAYPMQNDRDAAFRAAQKFVSRNAQAISQRKNHLSSLGQSERDNVAETAFLAIS
jgi:hypothetical protein